MKDWLVVPDKPYVAATCPLPREAVEGVDCRRAVVNNVPLTILPHDYRTWRTLRGRGMLAPSPICRYEWPGPFDPMAHQKATAGFFIEHDKAFCLNGLRTGKTLSALWASDYLQRVGEVRRTLIVAPLFICDIVWERAIFQTLHGKRAVLVKGSRKRKLQIARDTRFPYIIVNPESLHLIVDDLREVDLIIVDEFTRFKSVRVGGKPSVRYGALRHASQSRRLWMLSATPAPQAPTDAYGPIRLVNPRRLGFVQFRDMTMIKVNDFKWIPRDDAHETIARWMQPAIRFKREDCIDIPEVAPPEDLDVALSKEQRQVIQSFVDEARAMVGDGVDIHAANAAGVMLKILQVMAGGVYGDDPEGGRATHKVDAKPFMEAIEAVVQEADGPVLLFSTFQCSVDIIAEHLTKAGFRVGKRTRGRSEISGQGRVQSMRLFDAFQNGDLDVLVAIPETMRYGLELTRSHVVLWASPPFSFESYEQANARVTGASQKYKVMVLHLVQNALAKELFNRLVSKEELQNAVLDLIEHSIEG